MDRLPPEILDLILAQVDQKSKRYLRQVCTTLFELIDFRNFTIYFSRSKQLPDMVKVFSRYKKPISLTFTKTISRTPTAFNHLSKLSHNIISLYIDVGEFNDKQIKHEMAGLNRLTKLQRLDFGSRNNSARMFKSLNNLTRIIMESCPNDAFKQFNGKTQLLELDLGKANLNSIQQIPNISNLTSLKIECTSVPFEDTAHILSQASQLKSLDLASFYPEYFGLELRPVHITALSSLENIKIESYPIEGIENIVGLTKLQFMDQKRHPNAKNWTTLTNLKVLEIELYTSDLEENDIEFITALSNLDEFMMFCQQLPTDFYGFLPQRLTRLEVASAGGFVWEDLTRLVNLKQLQLNANYSNGQQPFNFYFLTSLVNLTQLELMTLPGTFDEIYTLTCGTELRKLRAFAVSVDFVDFFPSINCEAWANLESLKLPIIDSDTARSLSRAMNLTRLEACAFTMVYSAIKNLPLRVLRVKDKVSDEFWQSLVRMTRLESLRLPLENDKITQEARIVSLSTLHRLTRLEFSQQTLPAVKSITCLTSLQQLKVSLDSRRPDDSLKIFEKCCKLKKRMPYLYSVTSSWDGMMF